MLSAKAVCILSYWAKLGGLAEAGTKLSLDPQNTGGNYSKHFDKVTGIQDLSSEYTYKFESPGLDRATMSREVLPGVATYVYKDLAADLEGQHDVMQKIEAAADTESWGVSYKEHELVRGKIDDDIIVPLAIYSDGVVFQKRDTAIGMWLINLLTQQRYLVWVVRKRLSCPCGCAGWCTMWTYYKVFA